jgi:hypothetical protein
MATTIAEWRIKEYTSGLFMLAQQKVSRLLPNVTVKSGIRGNQHFLEDMYGQAEPPEKVTTRAPQTPSMAVDKYRTAMFKEDWQWGSPLIDDFDRYEIDENVELPYKEAGAAAVGRDLDRIILGTYFDSGANANAVRSVSGLFGNRYTGENGMTPVTFPTTAYTGSNAEAAYVVPVDLGGVATGLTVQKLLAAGEILTSREVAMDGETPTILVTAKEITQMLSTVEATSREYSSLLRLESREIDTFMGFRFVRVQQLPKNGSGHRRCIVYLSRYLVLGQWLAPNTELLTRPDRSNARQFLTKYSLSAARYHEEGFVEILCAE